MTSSNAYHEGNRLLQDRFDTRRIADRLEERNSRDVFNDADRAFITSRDMFFLATADEHGVPQTWRARGWPARILQHEVDHLDGMLYVDRMKTRSFATSEQAKALYSGKPIAEIREMLGL